MFKFELTEALTNVILEALAQQPLAKSFDAFVSMRSQMAQQRVPLTSAATAPPQAVATTEPPQTNGAANTE